MYRRNIVPCVRRRPGRKQQGESSGRPIVRIRHPKRQFVQYGVTCEFSSQLLNAVSGLSFDTNISKVQTFLGKEKRIASPSSRLEEDQCII